MSDEEPEMLKVVQRRGEADSAAVSRAAITPYIQGALTTRSYINPYFREGGANLNGLAQALNEQAEQANKGDFSHAEAMLATQAATLDAIFHQLAQQANGSEYMDKMERYMRLAFKAQSQCRTTLEALAEVKAPKAVQFVRQANFAQGHQQVNNYDQSDDPAHASPPKPRTRGKGKSAKQTKQVEHHEQQTLDPRGTATAGRDDQEMEAVGAVDGPQDKKG